MAVEWEEKEEKKEIRASQKSRTCVWRRCLTTFWKNKEQLKLRGSNKSSRWQENRSRAQKTKQSQVCDWRQWWKRGCCKLKKACTGSPLWAKWNKRKPNCIGGKKETVRLCLGFFGKMVAESDTSGLLTAKSVEHPQTMKSPRSAINWFRWLHGRQNKKQVNAFKETPGVNGVADGSRERKERERKKSKTCDVNLKKKPNWNMAYK